MHARPAQVGVDQQHAAVVRLAQRQREVRRRQRFAVARHGARDHDHFQIALDLRVMQRRRELAVLLHRGEVEPVRRHEPFRHDAVRSHSCRRRIRRRRHNCGQRLFDALGFRAIRGPLPCGCPIRGSLSPGCAVPGSLPPGHGRRRRRFVVQRLCAPQRGFQSAHALTRSEKRRRTDRRRRRPGGECRNGGQPAIRLAADRNRGTLRSVINAPSLSKRLPPCRSP